MEKVSYLPNGQWVLEKWSLKDIGNAVEWTESGMHRFLNELPKAKGAMRRSMLKDLETDMDMYNRAPGLQIRVNSQTNKKEYLLHRLQNVLPSNKASSDQPRSWTHSKDFCHLWSLGQDSPTRIISAWIPEDHIHSYLPTASKIQSPYYDYKDEGEVLVLPHKLNIVNIEHPRPHQYMEKVSYLPNGQWVLSKAIPRVLDHYYFQNRHQDNIFTDKDADDAQNTAVVKALKFNKNSVKKMLNEKGEPEDHILLHRGITTYDSKKINEYNKFKILPNYVETADGSVNTLYPNIAHMYSQALDDERMHYTGKQGKVISFWVPKSKIHHMGSHPASEYSMEHEEDQMHTSVKPGKFIRATPEEVALVKQS